MKPFSLNELINKLIPITIGVVCLLFGVFCLTSDARAAVCSNPFTYADGQVLTASQLNGSFNTAFSCVNSIDNSNIATGANIDPLKINPIIDGQALSRSGTDGSLSVAVDGTTIEINTDALRLKDLSVSTGKIIDGSVTGVKLNSNVVDNSTIEFNSSALRLKDGGVTIAKMAAVSSASTTATAGNVATGPVTPTTVGTSTCGDVTDSSRTITTTGRPVIINIAPRPNGTNDWCYFDSAAAADVELQVFRDAVQLGNTTTRARVVPVSFLQMDFPAAGTYVYKIRLCASSAGGVTLNECQFSIYEL